MNRSDVNELYYITHIDNLESILRYGILCYYKAKKILRKSIADPEIQERREKVVIPGGKHKLHDYANLYFNARNSMMYKRKDIHREICILRINPAILDKPNVIISDKNASSDYVRFYSPKELDKLDGALIFSNDWRNNDYYEYRKRKSATCAEVLVLGSVVPKFIIGAHVSCRDTRQKVIKLLANNVSINPKLFFQEV